MNANFLSTATLWLALSRPRTLFLAASTVFAAAALALRQTQILDTYFYVFFSSILLIVFCLQILANWANDLGDGLKGTDAHRIGPARVVQSQKINILFLKKALSIFSAFIFIFIFAFLYFLQLPLFSWVIFLFLGGFSLWAALNYTWGKKAYGYYALGDAMVFLFFGPLGVLGSLFLYTRAIDANQAIFSLVVGFLATAVLNVNNLRDSENDVLHHKKTMANQLGEPYARYYHVFLIASAFLCALYFLLYNAYTTLEYFCLFAFLPLFLSAGRIVRGKKSQALDKELPLTAVSTFIFTFLFLLFTLIE